MELLWHIPAKAVVELLVQCRLCILPKWSQEKIQSSHTHTHPGPYHLRLRIAPRLVLHPIRNQSLHLFFQGNVYSLLTSIPTCQHTLWNLGCSKRLIPITPTVNNCLPSPTAISCSTCCDTLAWGSWVEHIPAMGYPLFYDSCLLQLPLYRGQLWLFLALPQEWSEANKHEKQDSGYRCER